MRTRSIIAATVAWAAAVFVAAVLTVRLAPEYRSIDGHWNPSLDRYAAVAPLAHWDSYWYWRIAEDGYHWSDDRKMHSVVFFPLYPMILAAVRGVLHPFVAGEIVSVLALVAAAVAVARHAESCGFDARWTLAALLLFPKSMYFVAAYTESLFLLLAAACLLAARRGRFGWAAAAGFLAALTRPTGIVLALPLAGAAWERRREGKGNRRALHWGAVLAPAAGAAAFGAFLWARFGSPLVGVRTEALAWGHHVFEWPGQSLAAAFAPHGRPFRVTLFFFAAFAAAGIVLWRRKFRIEALYVLGSIAFVVETGALASGPRYTAVLYPAFFVVGDAMRRWKPARWSYLGVGGAALLYETVKFSLGGWVS